MSCLRVPVSHGVALVQTFVPSFVVNGCYFSQSSDVINHYDSRRHRTEGGQFL